MTALHLNRLGIDAVVFEASSEVRALGVGINQTLSRYVGAFARAVWFWVASCHGTPCRG